MAATLEVEVVALLRPCFSQTRQFHDDLRFHNNDWPPTVDYFRQPETLKKYLRAQWPRLQRNIHMKKADRNASRRVYTNFIGHVMVLATNSSLEDYIKDPNSADMLATNSSAHHVCWLSSRPTTVYPASYSRQTD
jgi:hypothetical protein